jgi:uncharacterized repeat protein (TIGR03803 family)
MATALPAQTLTSIFSFNGVDGRQPLAPLFQATDGNLYGTTAYGGAHPNCTPFPGCGTIFKITPSGTLTTIYDFCAQTGCPDGSQPNGLIQATDGDFYGTTWGGGADDVGTVFKITADGTLTTLYSFCGDYSCGYGEGPSSTLVQAANGDFYGTTSGYFGGDGTVFKITASGTLTTLYSFCVTGCADGRSPYAGLVQARDGDFYGTTAYGGYGSSGGTIFKITPSGTLTLLYSFCAQVACADGQSPFAALVQATNGDFYGTTMNGGNGGNCAGGCGTIFKITPSGALTTLYNFCADDSCPHGGGGGSTAGLVQATDGNLYGTSFEVDGHGTVFKLTPSGTLTTLYRFCDQTGPTAPMSTPLRVCMDGELPRAGLVQAVNGDLYGTTSDGGIDGGGAKNGDGTVFRLSLGLQDADHQLDRRNEDD